MVWWSSVLSHGTLLNSCCYCRCCPSPSCSLSLAHQCRSSEVRHPYSLLKSVAFACLTDDCYIPFNSYKSSNITIHVFQYWTLECKIPMPLTSIPPMCCWSSSSPYGYFGTIAWKLCPTFCTKPSSCQSTNSIQEGRSFSKPQRIPFSFFPTNVIFRSCISPTWQASFVDHLPLGFDYISSWSSSLGECGILTTNLYFTQNNGIPTIPWLPIKSVDVDGDILLSYILTM